MIKNNETESEVDEGDSVEKKNETYLDLNKEQDSETNQLNETESEIKNKQYWERGTRLRLRVNRKETESGVKEGCDWRRRRRRREEKNIYQVEF